MWAADHQQVRTGPRSTTKGAHAPFTPVVSEHCNRSKGPTHRAPEDIAIDTAASHSAAKFPTLWVRSRAWSYIT